MRRFLFILIAVVVCVACKQQPPPKSAAPVQQQPAAEQTPPSAPTAEVSGAMKDSVDQVIATFIAAMQAGDERKAKTTLALEFFEKYALPHPVEIKQYQILDYNRIDSVESKTMPYEPPPQIDDVLLHTNQIMSGNLDMYGSYWLRKINGYWKIYAWGIN